MVILTDTNIIIDYLRSQDKQKTVLHKLFYIEDNIPAINLSIITEIWQGKSMSEKKELDFVEKLLEGFNIYLSNIDIAKKTGEILRESHYQMNFQDAEIVACALYHNLPLLTKNTKDFKKIKGLKLLPASSPRFLSGG